MDAPLKWAPPLSTLTVFELIPGRRVEIPIAELDEYRLHPYGRSQRRAPRPDRPPLRPSVVSVTT